MTKAMLTRDDIMDMDDYAKVRKQRRAQMTEKKKNRRLHCGPHATFYFESFDTMWHQVHEMLFIEKGSEEQIEDELRAYNPLIPNGRELVATVMFEINDEERRHAFLAKLGGIEETMFLRFGEIEVLGVPEVDLDRTTESGKASSVQFIHFPFTDEQAKAFRESGGQTILGFEHAAYGHMTVIPEESRELLAGDLTD